MKIEWDNHKNKVNIQKHGIDFADAVEIFNGPMLVRSDDRVEYGEERYIGIGFLQSKVAVVVYTEVIDDNIRIISVRKATKNESKKFEKRIKDRLG